MRLCHALVLSLYAGALAVPASDRSPAFRSASCRCGVRNGSGLAAERIVGGREAEINEFPWQAALMWRGRGWAGCGATIISSRHILTAAHCTRSKNPEDLSVLVRSHRVFQPDADSLRFDVEQIIDYPNFGSVHDGNDFSLLRLTAAMDFPLDNSFAPACLPPAGEDFVDANATVSGYGSLSWGGGSANALRAADVSVVSQEACDAAYPGQVHATMLCAYGAGERDSCQGDSGGPLVSQRDGRLVLIGVVSWGKECAKPGYPGVYSRVTEALGWIREHTAGAGFCR